MTEFVKLEVDDAHVATVRIDRAPVNALNVAVQEELREVAAEIAGRDDIRAVILWGGDKVFVAGADVKEFHRMSAQDMQRRAKALSSSLDAIAQLPMPVIAAVTGYALGGGCELALTADFRISADNAKWGQPEILLGIIPGAGGTQRLPRLIGPAKAKDLIFSGRHVRAEEARTVGLVDAVVPADDVHAEAVALVRRYATGPAYALRAAKQAIDEGLDTSLDAGLNIERKLFAGLFATEDRSIGMDTFVESGPGKARFVGQ